MPLVTLCGLPAAGKTTFAEGLVAFLKKELPEQQGRAREEGEEGGGGAVVVLVNEEALHVQKAEGYRGEKNEGIGVRVREFSMTMIAGGSRLRRGPTQKPSR
jgi:tRNA uridine 5-carbamoylmethylation protein Kti12